MFEGLRERFTGPVEFGTPKDAVLSVAALGSLSVAEQFPQGSVPYDVLGGVGIALGIWVTGRLFRSEIAEP